MERISQPLKVRETLLNLSYLKRRADSLAPWVVMLHGLQSSSDVFLPLCSKSFLKPFSLLAVDFVGFGHSSKPSDFSYDLSDQKEVVEDILKKEDIKECVVIGQSMGGMVGCLLLNSPTIKVSKFACLEGNLRPEDGDFSTTVSEMDFGSFEEKYFPSFLDGLSKGNGTEKLRFNALNGVPAFVVYRTSRSIAAHARSRELLAAFTSSKIKRSLIRGAQSKFGAMPTGTNCSEYIIPSSGHFLLLDNPTETFRAIEKLLT